LTDRVSKLLLIGLAAIAPFFLAYAAYSRPGYFTSQTYLGGLLVFEFLFAAVWFYRQIFFPLVLIAFLLAGVDLPVGSVWITARWVFLCAGALAGTMIMLKDRSHRIGAFHAMALFCILSAVVSAAVCRYTGFALLKVLSLFLLFLYCATGARLAVTGRESRFFSGLLLGCEIFTAVMAAFYFVGIDAMGNPNSLGAIMGVVMTPMLLWGTLLPEAAHIHQRRQILCAIAFYLTIHSQSRAGIATVLLACSLLCVSLRRYKLMAQCVGILVILITASAIINPDAFSQTVSNLTESFVYKGKDPNRGILASRETPWQGAIDSIKKHYWFGSGFGVTDNGQDASAHLSTFETHETVSRENGSSYLTIVTWVGMAGVWPFAFLMLGLMSRIMRTVFWMMSTHDPLHPAVPLAIIIFAGLLHAGFEDWLFAPGYYLTVFFWAIAFILVDVAPWAPFPSFTTPWRAKLMREAAGHAAFGR
jgi:hypothetical protein